MRRFLWALVLTCVLAASAAAQEIRGSGSTFVFPIMSRWIETYAKAEGWPVAYRPIGSAAGLNDIRHAIVDFAISEAPLDSAQLLRDGLAQWPLVLGAIACVVNVDGISAGQLRLTGPVLADIYLGKVVKWNDPILASLNPGLALPDLKIAVVHRSDGSGSSFTWTDYLSKVSVAWKARVGANTMVQWPIGFGARHSRGVAESVARTRGAIGYLDYGYAVREKLAYALVRNQAGTFVALDGASFEAATTDVDWAKDKDFYVSLTDGAAANAYPIMAVSFVVVRARPKDPERTRRVQDFFRWVMMNGQDQARSLGYVAVPSSILPDIEGYWKAGYR
jgi:phosphate transport system substrate-binding protein